MAKRLRTLSKANPERQDYYDRTRAAGLPVCRDARSDGVLMAMDAQRMMEWLGAAPLRTLTGDAIRQWTRSQDPPWTAGYSYAVQAIVEEELWSHNSRQSGDVRMRLTMLAERLIEACSSYRTGTAPDGGGTVVLTDPKTGELMTEIEHTAVLGYMRLLAQMNGLITEKHQHQHAHLHAGLASGDLSEVPTEELERVARLTIEDAAQE